MQNGAWVDMGVSPGWADVYTWDTPSQYIDITRVHSGVYDVVARTNPAGALLVAGPSSVCATTRITLTATKVRALAMEPHTACP